MNGSNPRGHDVNLRSGPQLEEYHAIVRRIKQDAPANVLDWGCGWGQVSDLLDAEGLEVTSFDYRPTEPAGIHPLERFPHLSAQISHDPRRLPFGDGQFEAVLSCGVLEHVEDPDASLEEIKRVLAPRGTFYVYKLPNRVSYLEVIAKRTGLYYHGAFEFDRVYTLQSALDLIRRHDFAVTEARYMNMLPLTLTHRVAQRFAAQIWAANRRLSSVPGINRLATNIEVIARRAG